MEVQTLPLLTPETTARQEQKKQETSVWTIVGNTLGLGLFLFSLLVFFDLLTRGPGI